MTKLYTEQRASAILFNFLRSNASNIHGKFLLPSNVCPIVPITFQKAEIEFEFIDIDAESLLMDENLLFEAISKGNVGGVLYVRSYGIFSDKSSLFVELKALQDSIILIDDRCICKPDIEGSEIYQESDLTLFSTGYAKYVEFGTGGFGFVSERCGYAQHLSKFVESNHTILVNLMQDCMSNGNVLKNPKIDWLAFGTLDDEAKYFSDIVATRKKVDQHKAQINLVYSTLLPPEIQYLKDFHNWRFNLQVDNKTAILDAIFAGGLFASSHYASVSHLFGHSRSLVADRSHDKMLNLFNDNRFDISKAEKVCKIINQNLA